MVSDRIKKFGKKTGDKIKSAKGKVATSFTELYRKKGITPESGGDEGAGQEEKKSIFSKISGTLKGIGKKKCKACGSTDLEFFKEDEKLTEYRCKECNAVSNFYKKKKKKEPTKEPEKEDGEELGKEGEGKKKESRLKGASIFTSIGSFGVLVLGLLLEIPPSILIIIGIILAIGLISLIFPFLRPYLKLMLIAAFVGGLIILYLVGGFEDFKALWRAAIPPRARDQIEEAANEILDNIVTAYETSICYTKVNPDLVEACLGELEAKEEEDVRKIGKNENLKLTYGQRVGSKTFENLEPNVDRRYNYYFMLKNENSEEYGIEVTDITVVAVGDEVDAVSGVKDDEPGALKRHVPYTIEPQEELPVRIEWNLTNTLPECTNSIEFLINITSVQTSGGGSGKYGLVPREEGHLSFLHYFDPQIETNPGPLDIYVFTDPYAVNTEWYSTDGFTVFIKIKNKAEGTAFLDNIILVQTFDTPDRYFEITECYDDEGHPYNPSIATSPYIEGECGGNYPSNCFTLDFTQWYKHFNLTNDETREIVCGARFLQCTDPCEIDELTGSYTDLISVFAPSYKFLQEFKETKIADCGGTIMSTGFTCTSQGNQVCTSGDTCCCLCMRDAFGAGLNTLLGEGSGFGCSDEAVCTAYPGESPYKGCYCP